MAVLQILLSLVAAFAVGTDSLSVPLHQGQGDVSRNQLVARAVHRNLQERSTGLESVIRDTAGFWYGSVDVGDSKGLSLVLDTASLYVVTNTGLYQPSAASIDLNDTYTFGLASTDRKKDDGYEIGVADLKNPGSGCP
ncbi:unnamed protein product [Zymoseptoria tritici ST99CH_1E4]|uniref:Peptidase A1 domain-containing protein n=1 Tax=Zymoseptoria tritici ST99CH_1E4 TaxID=1276532 RepID=A0A2H1GXH4_ZYMTR|nr:unnamed protein product [Zymoseptoria tritici ST99CH_1E4]